MITKLTTLFTLIFAMNLVEGQNDTVVVSDHIVLVGTVKKINSGVISIETEFSKDDIRIEREEIKSIVTKSQLIMIDRDGLRYYGTLKSSGKDSIYMTTDDNRVLAYHWDDLYRLEEYRRDFKHRFSFSIDIGFSMAQANNLIQWSSNGFIGYKANDYIMESHFNGIIASQEDTEGIYRWEQQIEFAVFLPKNWFIHSELGFLTSSEQKIEARFVPRLGIGKILIRFNHINWNITGGGNMNFERYTENSEKRRTVEAFLGTDFNLIDLGDFHLSNRNSLFKSLTDADRWRFDTAIDLRYELPLNLYLSSGFTYNFDSNPILGTDGTDYVLRAGVGWEL